jgi:Arc/MetJ family transcription regulator
MPQTEVFMRTTINLDDDLLAEAKEYTGLTEKSELVREALRALIQREVARRLILLGAVIQLRKLRLAVVPSRDHRRHECLD